VIAKGHFNNQELPLSWTVMGTQRDSHAVNHSADGSGPVTLLDIVSWRQVAPCATSAG